MQLKMSNYYFHSHVFFTQNKTRKYAFLLFILQQSNLKGYSNTHLQLLHFAPQHTGCCSHSITNAQSLKRFLLISTAISELLMCAYAVDLFFLLKVRCWTSNRMPHSRLRAETRQRPIIPGWGIRYTWLTYVCSITLFIGDRHGMLE